MTIGRDDNEVSKRKKTERNHVATLQHPVLGQDPVLQQVGWNPPAGAEWGKAETRGAELLNGNSSDATPSFKKEKVNAKPQPQGRSFNFSSSISMTKQLLAACVAPDGGGTQKRGLPAGYGARMD